MSQKAIFLDRDNTLIDDVGYINHPDQVKLLDGVAEALKELKALDFKLIVVTNQSGVARGIVTEDVLGQIHNRLKQLLAEKGAYLDQIYYCPYHPDGVVPKYRKESDWMKPSPGMLLAGAEEMDIDLARSWCIGDSARDIEAGRRAGCKTVLISPSHACRNGEPGGPKPDYKSVNIREAVNIIKQCNRPTTERINQPEPAAEPQIELAAPTREELGEQETPAPPAIEPEPAAAETTEQLLGGILAQLKKMQRQDMFGEFSAMRLMAGVVQILVLFCLVITVWLMLAPNRQDSSVFIALGFALLFQLMSLTFYMMHGRK
ncbi:MAG: D-glycero-alpha-D-manno-heptose-1,7-bisphosphate 7-phosphatase [Planctomycetota bacterium]|jgi:D,D-heptose 1,7-bisphosphate phosphatase